MDGVEDMSPPVAQSAHAEVVPAAPFALVIFFRVVVPLRCAEPYVPVHALRHRVGRGETGDVGIELVPSAAVVHVGRDGGDVADDAGLLPCLELEVVGLRMALVAHLGDHLRVAAGALHHQLGLVERAAHGLLEVDVLAIVEGHHGDGEVDVVGHGGHDGVEVRAVLLEQFAEVGEALGLWEEAAHLLRVASVHVDIAEGHHVDHAGAHEVVDVLFAAVADADEGHFHLVAFGGGFLLSGIDDVADRAQRQCSGCQAHLFEELSSSCHEGYINYYLLKLREAKGRAMRMA